LKAAHKQRTAVGLAALNAVLFIALCVLVFDPQREAFGRATGLWHPCLPPPGGWGQERWSPLLLLIVGVPAALGGAAGIRSPGRIRAVAIGAAAAVLLLGLVIAAVPTASCVE
jgi:hypothetical protein